VASIKNKIEYRVFRVQQEIRNMLPLIRDKKRRAETFKVLAKLEELQNYIGEHFPDKHLEGQEVDEPDAEPVDNRPGEF
jgi:hypothetical protein